MKLQVAGQDPEAGLRGPGEGVVSQRGRDVLHVVVLQPELRPRVCGLTPHPGGRHGVHVDIGLQEVVRLNKEMSRVSDIDMNVVRSVSLERPEDGMGVTVSELSYKNLQEYPPVSENCAPLIQSLWCDISSLGLLDTE